MVLTSDGHTVIMTRSKERKCSRRSMVAMVTVLEGVISLKSPLWVFLAIGHLMICSFTLGTSFRRDTKKEHLLHFTGRPTERRIHSPDISFVLFPSRTASPQVNGKCLQTDLQKLILS